MCARSLIGFTDRYLRRQRAASALEAALTARPPYRGLRITRVIKAVETREVHLADWDGRPVVLKRFHGSDAAASVANLKVELDLLAPRMGDGPNQVMRCLAIEPDLGVAVLSLAPGPRLSVAIAEADAARRRHLLMRSGEWLAAYTAIRDRQARFGPWHWVEKAEKRRTSHLDEGNAALAAQLVDSLRGQARATAGSPVRQAATHGDFVPINLHIDGDVITGVDIQGECWLAVAREAARFLVWAALHDPRDGDRRHGLPAADLDSFLTSGVIPEAEHRTTLPFFIGEQIQARMIESGLPAELRVTAASVAAAYLDEHAPDQRPS